MLWHKLEGVICFRRNVAFRLNTISITFPPRCLQYTCVTRVNMTLLMKTGRTEVAASQRVSGDVITGPASENTAEHTPLGGPSILPLYLPLGAHHEALHSHRTQPAPKLNRNPPMAERITREDEKGEGMEVVVITLAVRTPWFYPLTTPLLPLR